jgi:ubiquitin-conjugating enzyme E2 C
MLTNAVDVSLFTEPNNDSPLNADAAALWANQETYKSVLLEKYEKDVRSKQS